MSSSQHESARRDATPLEQSLDDALGDVPSVAPEAPDPEAAARAHLVIVAGPEVGRLLHLSQEELVLGRADGLSGCLQDPSVSQRHAKVIWHDGRHLLVDLGSTNGTFVNNKRVTSPQPLTHRDTIRLGQTQLKFLAGPDAARGRDATVRLEFPKKERDPRQDLVRYRDASLASAPRHELSSRPNNEAVAQDWIFYARSAATYTKRYGLFVIVMAAVGLTGGVAHALWKPPGGGAFFEIALNREAKSNPVEDERSVQFFVAAEKSFTSIPLIKETLRTLGLQATDALALSVQQNLTFSSVSQTDEVWRAEYLAQSSTEAETLLKAHLKNYLEREVEKNLKVLRAEIELLEGQLATSATTLHDTETSLASFKEAHPGFITSGDGVLNDSAAGLDTLLARRDELSAQVTRLELELRLNRQRLTSGDALFKGRVDSASSYAAGLQDIEKQISEAKAEGLGEEHPKVKKLRAQAKDLQAMRDSAINQAPSDIERRSNESYVAVREHVKDLEVELQVVQAELGQVGDRLKTSASKAKDLPGAEASFSKLTRNYASTRSLHDKLYQKLQASRIQLQMEQASSRARYDLITPPTAEPPNMILTSAKRGGIGAFALMFFAVLFAATREGVRYLRSVL